MGRIGRVGRVGRTARAGGGAVVPHLLTATILDVGGVISLVFDKPVENATAGSEGFALTGLSGGATTLTFFDQPDGTEVRFDISRIVVESETGGVLAYTPGDIAAVGGDSLKAFSGFAVVNNSEQL